jgi:pimeloyl-ACP methyl ester carboxylesterase
VGLLDSFGLAHLVGMSMGGAIGQLMALDHPRRVAPLTLIATSPGFGDPESRDDVRGVARGLRRSRAGSGLV